MNRWRNMSWAAGTAVLVGSVCFAGQTNDKVRNTDSRGFDLLKGLAGTWVRLGEGGKPTDEVVSSIRVTAGGSAVHEVLFPGTEVEMITIYHQDGDDLVMTHYCMLGNQPRMKAEPGNEAGKVVFKCQGGSNMKSEDDKHMHQETITVITKDHINVEWLEFENGAHNHTGKFDLVRKKEK